MPWPKMNAQRWGALYAGAGVSGLLLLYAGALVPAVQRSLSRIETSTFYGLNHLMGHNPVWDWSILVANSNFWIYFTYTVSFFFFTIHAWRRRREDYGQIFGFILFAGLVTIITGNLADIISDNLHRVLPWKHGLLAQVRNDYGAHFIQLHKREGIVDDSTTTLSGLFLLMVLKSPRAALLMLAPFLTYIIANLITGTQWLTVQVSSCFMGAALAGLSLFYGGGPIRYLEKTASDFFVRLLGQVLLSRKIIEPSTADQDGPFWQMIRRQTHNLNVLGRRWFWENIVRRQALALLNIPPDGAKLYSSPDMTMAKVKSGGRVRFLKTATGEIFVVRAMRYWGGIFHVSPKFIRFTHSVKNNILLKRMGFPVPRVFWTQQGVTGLGCWNYFFAIEEYLPSRPLDPANPEEIANAMRLLARLHEQTRKNWGSLYEPAASTCAQYILAYLRGEVLYHFKMIDSRQKMRLSAQERNLLWKYFEAAAVEVFQSGRRSFRLVHGDVTPLNVRAGKDGSIRLIDFLTVHADLAGEEIIKAAVALTREHPEHCPLAWQAYFEQAGLERWKEFKREARLAFARFALRELAHGRAFLPREADWDNSRKAMLEAWLSRLFAPRTSPWGETPADTQWDEIYDLLGLEDRPGRPAGRLEVESA